MPMYTYQCQVCSKVHEELIFFSDYENDNIPKVCGGDTYEQGCGGDLYRVLRAPGSHSSWAGTGKHGVNGYFSKALGKHVANKHTEQKIMEGRGFVCEADLPKDRWDTAVETQKRRVTAQDKTIETYTEALKSGKTKEEAVVEAFPAHDAVSGKLDETWGKSE
jgi:predicted nucleic acid-binding Zn ribbon protein